MGCCFGTGNHTDEDVLVVPEAALADQQNVIHILKQVIVELEKRTATKWKVELVAPDMMPNRLNDKSRIILPCVVSSRLMSDLSHVVSLADIPKDGSYLIVMLHPKAPHVSDIFPTREKLSREEFTSACIVDFAFWDDKVYHCDSNNTGYKDLAEWLKKDR